MPLTWGNQANRLYSCIIFEIHIWMNFQSVSCEISLLTILLSKQSSQQLNFLKEGKNKDNEIFLLQKQYMLYSSRSRSSGRDLPHTPPQSQWPNFKSISYLSLPLFIGRMVEKCLYALDLIFIINKLYLGFKICKMQNIVGFKM